MLQQPIYVPNGEFWEMLEELDGETYQQEVTLDERLVQQLKESADGSMRFDEGGSCLLSWNHRPESPLFPEKEEKPQRTIVLVGERRRSGLYFKAVLIRMSKPFLGFRHPEYDSKTEFLFIAKD